MKNRPGFLVETRTEDGIRLKGFWQRASDEHAEQSTAAWILVHGVAGNFYDGSLLNDIANGLLDAGQDVVRINTRGHDALAYLSAGLGSMRCGAAFEIIADARFDLAAWGRWVRQSGYRTVGFLGHSLGAVKVACSLSAQPTLADLAICVSPPRLNAESLITDPDFSSVYTETINEARKLQNDGKSEQLMMVRFPHPMIVSATTYNDKYGGKQYDYLAIAASMVQATLWTFGAREVEGPRSSFAGCDAILKKTLADQKNHTVCVIDDADHNYTGQRLPLISRIRKWMDEEK